MNASRPLPLFLALVLAAVVYVLLTSRGLPPVVASQFDGAGAANGFMRRGFYIGFMLAFVAGLPLLVVGLSTFLFRRPHARLGIPNQAYWSAPDRRQETVDFLCQHMARFGSLLMLLLCFSHGLVVRANAQLPPKLSSAWFIGGLIVFLVLTLVWAGALLVRFRKMPREGG